MLMIIFPTPHTNGRPHHSLSGLGATPWTTFSSSALCRHRTRTPPTSSWIPSLVRQEKRQGIRPPCLCLAFDPRHPSPLVTPHSPHHPPYLTPPLPPPPPGLWEGLGANWLRQQQQQQQSAAGRPTRPGLVPTDVARLLARLRGDVFDEGWVSLFGGSLRDLPTYSLAHLSPAGPPHLALIPSGRHPWGPPAPHCWTSFTPCPSAAHRPHQHPAITVRHSLCPSARLEAAAGRCPPCRQPGLPLIFLPHWRQRRGCCRLVVPAQSVRD